MRRVEMIMGMPVSIDLPEVKDDSPFSATFSYLRSIDRQFSTYKPHSELSRYRANELQDDATSALFQEIKAACEMYSKQTEGYFSAYYNGSYDPTGLVKSWAIRHAATLLGSMGVHTYMINIAGDIFVASNTDKVWTIGVQDPASSIEILGTVSLRNGGVATSGTYERGHHIINPHTEQVAEELVSATVYGADIVTADVLATTCIAMGSKHALDFMKKRRGYEAFLVARSGKSYSTRSRMLKKQTSQR